MNDINQQVQHLSRIIDPTAFQIEHYYEDTGNVKMAVSNYWNERRRKALLLADVILKAGYRLE